MNMTTNIRIRPVWMQTFLKIKERSYVFVDKNDLLRKLALLPKYIFLNYSRQMGKTLLQARYFLLCRGM